MSAYYIASLKHTHKYHEHITWWGRMSCGYTPVVGQECGTYVFGYAVDLNDGVDHIAVPVEAVERLLSPEPYYKPGARMYDQRGPVVENTRENWKALLDARLRVGQQAGVRPKPEVFRGTRRALYTEQQQAA